jgi:hypothetical protein
MNEHFLPYKLSIELKEIGFKDKCLGYYIPSGKGGKLIISSEYNDDMCGAPVWEQVFDWFRDNHNIHLMFIDDYKRKFNFRINQMDKVIWSYESDVYSTYPKTRESAVSKLIEFVGNPTKF